MCLFLSIRESHQKLHLELTEIKRDAALTQRELDRVTHELDQATTHVQVRENEGHVAKSLGSEV